MEAACPSHIVIMICRRTLIRDVKVIMVQGGRPCAGALGLLLLSAPDRESEYIKLRPSNFINTYIISCMMDTKSLDANSNWWPGHKYKEICLELFYYCTFFTHIWQICVQIQSSFVFSDHVTRRFSTSMLPSCTVSQQRIPKIWPHARLTHAICGVQEWRGWLRLCIIRRRSRRNCGGCL